MGWQQSGSNRLTRPRLTAGVEPFLDVAPAISHVPPDSDAGRTDLLVAPPVESCHGHTQVRCDILDRQKTVLGQVR